MPFILVALIWWVNELILKFTMNPLFRKRNLDKREYFCTFRSYSYIKRSVSASEKLHGRPVAHKGGAAAERPGPLVSFAGKPYFYSPYIIRFYGFRFQGYSS